MRSEAALGYSKYLKEVFMPRTSTEVLASFGRESNNITYIVTADDIRSNEKWMKDAYAGTLGLPIGDWTVNGKDSAEDLLAVGPIQAHNYLNAAANGFKSRMEKVMGSHYKVVVSTVPAPDELTENAVTGWLIVNSDDDATDDDKADALDNAWQEYRLQCTPKDEGGRASKDTKAKKRDLDAFYLAVVPQG